MDVREIGTFDGQSIQEIRLRTESGATAAILTWGAVLRDLTVPMADGAPRHVVLGYADVAPYRKNPSYLGATVGRCCNRIADGRFTLDGQSYALPINGDGNVHLHGGPSGFTHRNWTIAEVSETSVTLALTSPDGDQGYPGRVDVTCRYDLFAPSLLRITMTGRTDAPTVLNMTNHSYFALAEGASSEDHVLKVAANFYTPAQANLVPTGEIRDVADTPYDFRTLRRIGDGGIDYDINFVLGGPPDGPRPVAWAQSPSRDLELEVITDQPGLLLYTGASLFQAAPGLNGQSHTPRSGFCLESYRFTDSINKRHFPSVVLRPGEAYTHTCEYRFRPL